MPLPESHEWEVRNTRLGKACRALYPYAEAWRDTVLALEAEPDGRIPSPDAASEVRVLDEFLAACREVGWGGEKAFGTLQGKP